MGRNEAAAAVGRISVKARQGKVHSAGSLLQFMIERVERLQEKQKTLAEDIKDIFSEAKSASFDVKTIKQILKLRKVKPVQVEE